MAAIVHAVQATKGKMDGDAAVKSLLGWKFDSPQGPIMIDPQTRDIVMNEYLDEVVKGADGKLHEKVLGDDPDTSRTSARRSSSDRASRRNSSRSPRTVVLRHAGDQRQRHDEQRGRGGEQPGLDAAGIIGTGEDRRGDRDRDDRPDLHAHRP